MTLIKWLHLLEPRFQFDLLNQPECHGSAANGSTVVAPDVPFRILILVLLLESKKLRKRPLAAPHITAWKEHRWRTWSRRDIHTEMETPSSHSFTRHFLGISVWTALLPFEASNHNPLILSLRMAYKPQLHNTALGLYHRPRIFICRIDFAHCLLLMSLLIRLLAQL